MTYHSRGRSIAEVIAAAIFVGFLTGFVAVLCIGNYFRAKRAMERQKQRRLARLAGGGGNGVVDYYSSPQSQTSTPASSTGEYDEKQLLLSKPAEVPRRRNQGISAGNGNGNGDLLNIEGSIQPTGTLMSV